MLQFFFRRLLNGLLVMAGVILFMFLLFNVLPVNSASMTLGQRSDAESVKAVEHQLRLDKPWYVRLLCYANDISPLSLHRLNDKASVLYLPSGEVNYMSLMTINAYTLVIKFPYPGRSFQSHRRVSEIISENFPATAMLAIFSIVFASLTGIFLGVFAALKQNTAWDNLILFVSNLGISQPSFFAGFIIALVFGYYLGGLTGLSPQGSLLWVDDHGRLVYLWRNLVLPAFALGIRPVAMITQLTRNSMLDVLSMDFVRTARAKGLSHYKVIFRHALRNALNPVITAISGWLAALFTGAYFIEEVFSYNGLGSATINAIRFFDFPVVMGLSLFVALVFVLMNITTDMLYALTDPRVRLE